MRVIARPSTSICARCLRARSTRFPNDHVRHESKTASPPAARRNAESKDGEEAGAMSRRLAQMSEETIETGGRSAAKAVEEAGFSEDLKKQLQERILDAKFRNENAQAFAQANLPVGAGRGTRDIASAKPWEGTESVEDASLRMLNDAYRPLRTSSRKPGMRNPVRAPAKVDTGRPKSRPGAGVRLANARDKASIYETTNSGLSEEEREKFRDGLKARFQPGARATPDSIKGISSLANERIENAIARGQFKNLPRGKPLERDHNASSPFIDTTEYLMNKMIQRQDIVPPWIEKQQELVSTASQFRKRLRADWKRHVARVISSRGGSVETQIRLAEEYALAESLENPLEKKKEVLNTVDDAGHLSQITLQGELKVNSPDAGAADEDETQLENEWKVIEETFNDDGTLRAQPAKVVTVSTTEPAQPTAAVNRPMPLPSRTPSVPPFRDPQWERTERAYWNLAITNLNNLARSYNLMAPAIARKPYYYLDRELKSCFVDVAPQVAGEIRERALSPVVKKIEIFGHKSGGVLETFASRHPTHIHDDQKPQYGFKEFWKDLFAGSK